MNKKNNRSGFTLVELIVVMCLMGIIMGAVLNFIQPTAKLYKTTNTYLNEEEAVTTIANALEDDLMYATGVYVYATDDETKGPAEIENIITEIFNDTGINIKEQNKSMSNCIVLDNVNVRDTPVAISKGSKGRILKYGYNGARFEDVSASGMLAGEKLYNNAFALQDQTFMGDDQFTFSIENSASSQNSMNIRMNVYRPSYNGTNYEYNELTFSAVKAIEFLNIKAGNVTVDYSNVNNAAVSNPKYIYIFYNRKPRINANAARYPYECYVKDATNNYISEPVWTSEYFEGDDISENVQKYAESSNIETFVDDADYVYERTGKYATVPGITDESDPNVVDLTCMPPASSTPMKLYAVYTRTHITAMPMLNVYFYKHKDKLDGYYQASSVIYYKDVTPPPVDPDPVFIEPPTLPEMTPNGTLTYKRWADCNTDQPVNSFDHITSNLEVYPQDYHYYAVTFINEDGDVIPEDQLKDADGNALGNNIPVLQDTAIATIPDIAQSGLQVESGKYTWVNAADDTPFTTETVITAPMTVKLDFVPTPAKNYTIDYVAEEINKYWNNNVTINPINITNNGTEDIVDDITIKIKFDCNVAAITTPAQNWKDFVVNNGGVLDTTFSGDTVTIVVKFKPDSSEKFTPGTTIKLENLTVSLTSETGKFVGIE